jgi:hypothetical protein
MKYKRAVERKQAIFIIYPLLEIPSKYYYDMKKARGKKERERENDSQIPNYKSPVINIRVDSQQTLGWSRRMFYFGLVP